MAELETRKLGNTGMTPRALGLGCATFGGDKSSDRDTTEGVRRAIELGIDYVDTSPSYGESERRVGLALKAAGGTRSTWRPRPAPTRKGGGTTRPRAPGGACRTASGSSRPTTWIRC